MSFSFSGWSQAGSNTRGGWQIWSYNSSHEALIIWLVQSTVFSLTALSLAPDFWPAYTLGTIRKVLGAGEEEGEFSSRMNFLGVQFSLIWIFKASALIFLEVLAGCVCFFVSFKIPLRGYVFSNGQSINGLLAFICYALYFLIYLSMGHLQLNRHMGYKNTSLGLKQRLRPWKEFLSYGTLLVFLPHVGCFQRNV